MFKMVENRVAKEEWRERHQTRGNEPSCRGGCWSGGFVWRLIPPPQLEGCEVTPVTSETLQITTLGKSLKAHVTWYTFAGALQ